MSEHTETSMSVASTAERQRGTDGSEYSVFLETISLSVIPVVGSLSVTETSQEAHRTVSFRRERSRTVHIPSRTVAVSSWGSAVTPERGGVVVDQGSVCCHAFIMRRSQPSAPRGAPC